MSYLSQAQLAEDPEFQARCTASAVEQSNVYKDDQRPDFVALSSSVLKGSYDHIQAFVRLNSAGPGIGNKVDVGDGTIDQSLVTDGDLLSLTQMNFPVITELYYTVDGAIKY